PYVHSGLDISRNGIRLRDGVGAADYYRGVYGNHLQIIELVGVLRGRRIIMKSSTTRHVLTHVFIIALGALMIYPVIWMIVSSFKPNNMIFSDTSLIPKAVTIDNYITGWKGYAGT